MAVACLKSDGCAMACSSVAAGLGGFGFAHSLAGLGFGRFGIINLACGDGTSSRVRGVLFFIFNLSLAATMVYYIMP